MEDQSTLKTKEETDVNMKNKDTTINMKNKDTNVFYLCKFCSQKVNKNDFIRHVKEKHSKHFVAFKANTNSQNNIENRQTRNVEIENDV